MVTIATIEGQLRDLGVRRGDTLLVHTSFSRVRPVEGGPVGLITALRRAIGSEGTLVMPTMTDGAAVFDPRSTKTYEMGITAELFWQQDDVLRSTHPSGSFAAVGPKASVICAPQPLSPPHGHASPPGRVFDLGGKVLLLGVDYDACTLLHVAEDIARVPYSIAYPCVVDVDGAAQSILVPETDHCCEGFCQMDAWLGALRTKGAVGNAVARLASARDIMRVALERLTRDPLVFLCAPGTCDECDLAHASVPRTR